MIREGLSHRYTLMTLLGLYRAQTAGYQSPIEIEPVLDSLLTNLEWITSAGDLGLCLWSLLRNMSPYIGKRFLTIDLSSAIERYSDTSERRTMELAWFLSGLSHMRLAKVQNSSDYTGLAFKTYELLKDNQGPRWCIFGHLARQGSFAGIFRARIGTFADQVYPIYALSKFAKAYDAPAAIGRGAKQCATAICRYQGPLGQWWWHYDSDERENCRRISCVFSASGSYGSDGLVRACGNDQPDFSSSIIYKGLNWITGKNELNYDMRDPRA